MNHYRFSDITIGKEEKFETVITSEMMSAFREITGDTNPLHTDRKFAESRGYHDQIVYGMLTSSLLSTLAGVYLPGENSLILSVKVKFVKPVFVGDKLIISGIVTEKQELFSIFEMKVTITNQKQEKVLRGSMEIGVTTDGK